MAVFGSGCDVRSKNGGRSPPCGSVNQGSPMDVSIVSRGWVGGSASSSRYIFRNLRLLFNIVQVWCRQRMLHFGFPPLSPSVLGSIVLGFPVGCFKTASRQWQFQCCNVLSPAVCGLSTPYVGGFRKTGCSQACLFPPLGFKLVGPYLMG